ncbi:amidophosphoribosyltransferase [Brevibacterium sp. UMB10442]|uniref:amidophosphoribosyltransferase n=1 Tax=Brevibacterium sp. UMB1308A TaxID=3050608 RepID=UPI00254A7F46|nr:amidophosphoribosyltransferase [Brevibacterium sp. UMB1308A]MDK7750729.1 amidophosphoribosyltransferase [Brevibacterium sp. UMB10442]MDK8346265.1 amidophosphoribosyltransferase [Brevibacterium sp. UMB1308B]MDK8712495.1 amidophosphoribosyltransferase [Brevibacterium sp. UMB1308A]
MARADGLLTDQIDPSEKAQDECGVFGVFAPGEEVAKLVYFGLYALQHRGQESAGIAASNGSQILVYRDMGLVSQVFSESDLETLPGHLAVGHTRYSTTGSSTWANAQPTLGPTPFGTVALAHNGNLTNFAELEALADDRRHMHQETVREATQKEKRTRQFRDSSNDTSLVTELLATTEGDNLTEAALELFPKLTGAFSLVFMEENRLYAARDPWGVRPLSLGRLEHGWVVASETAALDIVGASFVRDVEPGELIVIDEEGLRSHRFAEPTPARCVFEYVYLSRPDSVLEGKTVHAARTEMGRELAREYPVDADLVIATPESGTPAAVGYAEESGIPYGQGLMKNAYVGRTFIQPTQTIRQLGIRLKLNPLRENIEGKRLVVVDDSIVRGNTQRALVRMLREAGAREIHIRISAPPVKWPCFYGIDFASRAELIANGLNTDEICQSLGADSLGYISLDGMIKATQQNPAELCTACFSGTYPIPLPDNT